jgi:hypothetical protein
MDSPSHKYGESKLFKNTNKIKPKKIGKTEDKINNCKRTKK